MRGNGYTVGFAFAICVICSLLLSGVSSALKDKQELNRVLDRQKNILVALGFDGKKVGKMKAGQVQETYKNNIEEMVISPDGDVQAGKKPSDLEKKVATGEAVGDFLAVYKRTDPSDRSKAMAYAYPVTGKGLWSTLYGYLAVKDDGSEIVGLSFYKHGETPGLGAEIEKPWFRTNFVGKSLYEGDSLVGITVVKGLAKDNVAFKTSADHMVDGISGATLTGNGVMRMTKVVPRRYEKFFAKVKSGQVASAPAPTPTPAEPVTDDGQPGEGLPDDANTVGEPPVGDAPPAPGADTEGNGDAAEDTGAEAAADDAAADGTATPPAGEQRAPTEAKPAAPAAGGAPATTDAPATTGGTP
jgi:Na+-transporting NADH:ubiquinone oxidoreductase subunit C